MEEENKALGESTEALENDINLESEDFNFCHKNKEEARKNIEKTAEDIDAFMETLLADVPGLSEAEIDAGIGKLLEKTHPAEKKAEAEPVNAVKSKKVTLRVLFIAAVLALVSVSVLFVTGTRHNISIENGFASFARDTVQVVFFGEGEEYISVDSLLADLEAHGFTDIVFPQEFVTNSDEYKVSVPEYFDGEVRQVAFNIFYKDVVYKFAIYGNYSVHQSYDYEDIDNGDTIIVGDICIYIMEFDDRDSILEFVYNGYRYCIKANIPYSEMSNVARGIK